jgi:23S rRNA G2445 N2-methylase RlmL
VRAFATAAKGTERALRDELSELEFADVRATRGGVHFSGPRREAHRACLWSRVAVRIFEELASFDCPDDAALYENLLALDLSEVLTPRQTLAVSAACRSSFSSHSQYLAQRAKDAIVDRQRQHFGSRPDVQRDDPDVQFFLHLVKDRATFYLDHSGTPLHLRGYRKGQGEAPLKENLAAAMLRLAGFKPDQPVNDPMCGSGTLLIEAALWATNRAPGLFREHFGFERWHSHDDHEKAAWQDLREAARALARPAPAAISGGDIDPRALAITLENARSAGVELSLSERAISEVRPESASGLLVVNAPYGERLVAGNDLPRQLARLIDRFPHHYAGLLLSAEQSLARTRRKPFVFELFNGDLACCLRTYQPIRSRDAEPDVSRD